MKKCSHCKDLKELKEFSKDSSSKDKKSHRCKECFNKMQAKSYIKHRDEECLPFRRYRYGINKAKYRKLIWDISYEQYSDLIKICDYCKRDISKEVGVGLDRIDNNLGYITTNVVPCCGECNIGRGNRFTYKEWKAAINAIMIVRNIPL